MAIVSNNIYNAATDERINTIPIPAGSAFYFTGLPSDTEFFFYATNIDSAGLESEPGSVLGPFVTQAYTPPPAETPLSGPDQTAIDAIVAAQILPNSTGIPGAIISVTGPRGYCHKAYGRIGAGLGSDLLTTDDHFRIGSDTKIFTAMTFWQAVDDGLVSLGDVLEDYVPGVPNGNVITMEQLLTHRSGVYEYTMNLGVLLKIATFPTSAFTEADALDLIKSNPSQFAPGSQYKYSNSNAILIGAVVESVRGGQRLPQIMQDSIFDPLGMTETSWPTGVNATMIPEPAAGKAKFNPELAGAAGALVSTIGDLTKFAQALRDGLLISSQSWDIWTNTFPDTGIPTSGVPHPPDTFDYGHFLFRFGSLFGHDGSIKGFGCGLVFDPVSGATIAVSGNLQSTAPFYVILRNIAAYLYPDSVLNNQAVLTLRPTPALLTITGGVPAVTEILIEPNPAVLSITGGTAGLTIEPTAATLALSGATPDVTLGSTFTPFDVDTDVTADPVPAGASGCWVTLNAAGGAAGSGARRAGGSNRCGGGGGGGGAKIMRTFIPAASLGPTYSLTRGVGGVGGGVPMGTGLAGGNPGTDGGLSQFTSGSITMTANGGGGGGGGLLSPPFKGSGGVGGTASVSGVSATAANGTSGGDGIAGQSVAPNNTTGGAAGGGGGGSINVSNVVSGGGKGGDTTAGTGGGGGTSSAPAGVDGPDQAAGSPGPGGGGAYGNGAGGTGGDWGGGGGGGAGGTTGGTAMGAGGGGGGGGHVLVEWV